MRGSTVVRENKDGTKSYYLVVRPDGGKQKWLKVGSTRREADRNATRILNDMNKGDYVEPTTVTLGDYLERWLTDYVDAGYVRPRTAEGYRDIIRLHIVPQMGKVRLDRLNPVRIQAYYASRLKEGRLDGKGGLSAQTVKHHHTLLSRALNLAVRWDLLRRSPMDRVDAPRVPRREMEAYGVDAVTALLQQAEGTLYHPFILLTIFTGLRRSELLGLRWRDINEERQLLTVNQTLIWDRQQQRLRIEEPKSVTSTRPILLSHTPMAALAAHRGRQATIGEQTPDSLVFCRPDGTSFHPDFVSHQVIALARRAGLKGLSLHDIRHSNASILLSLGVHPEVVRNRLGHATISTTIDIYSHLLPGVQEEAAQKLEEGLSGLVKK